MFGLFIFLWISISSSERILVVREYGDLVSPIVGHINISVQYLASHYGFDNLTLEEVFVSNNSTAVDPVCNLLARGHGIISLVRDEASLEAVRNAAILSQVPTLQIYSQPWKPNSTLDFTPLDGGPNYVTIISPISIYQNLYESVFSDLNFTGTVNVVYDSSYVQYLSNWKSQIQQVHDAAGVKSNFVVLASNESMANQVNQLVQQSSNILLLATKQNAEPFVLAAGALMEQGKVQIVVWTKDISPFKCDDCHSVEILWIRPYYTGHELYIRDMMEYLTDNELLSDFNYQLSGDNELEVSFYLSAVMELVQILRTLNSTTAGMPAGFPCLEAPNAQVNNDTSPWPLLLDGEQREYGAFVKSESGLLYQDVPGRIFKIDRIRGQEDARYTKLVGNWSLSSGVGFYYGSLGVDVRTLNHYRIATLIQPPFVERFPDVNLGPEYQGYCIDLLHLIVDAINITYTLYEVEDGTFGSTDLNGNWNGLIGALVSGSADIALAPLSVMAERENDVDFTVPYYDLVGTTILMKKADVEYSLFKFMKVLEWPVWLCIVAAYLFTSLLLWVFDRFSPYSYTNNKERYKDDHEKRVFSLKECLWFCMTSLTPQGGGEAPKNVSGRLVAATWWLFGFIIIASYTANLAAFLTVSRLETSISSLDDLAKQYKIEYAPIKGSASETYFRRMAEVEEIFYNIWKEMSLNESMSPEDRAKLAVWDYPVSDKFTNMWRYMLESKLPDNMSVAIDRVLNSLDGFAFIGDATEIKYATLTNCKLQQVGTEFSRKPYAIAVQSGHPLKDPISAAILMLLNQRRLETLKERWWTDNPNKVICPDVTNESDGISIQNIGGVFIVILAGIVLSLFTLIIEYFYYRKYRRKGLAKEDTARTVEVVPMETIERNGTQKHSFGTTNGTTLKHRRESHSEPSNTISHTNQAFQF
ncbi:unnamed protein product, partial [Mesorhabditis spiculigera]